MRVSGFSTGGFVIRRNSEPSIDEVIVAYLRVAERGAWEAKITLRTEAAISARREASTGDRSVPSSADWIDTAINVKGAGVISFSNPIACAADR